MMAGIAQRGRTFLAVVAAISMVLSLVFVFGTPQARADTTATYEFVFDNGTVFSGNTNGGDAPIPHEFFDDFYGGHDQVPFDHEGLSIHVSCSETFPGGWASNGGFPNESTHSDWQIASYTIERTLGGGQVRNCGETFEPGSVKVVKNTTPETDDEFTFDLHGDIPPAPGSNGGEDDWSAYDDSQDVAGNGGEFTWTGLDTGEYTLGEDTSVNPTGYDFDTVSCSSDFEGFSYTTDAAEASFDLHGGETVICTFSNTGETTTTSSTTTTSTTTTSTTTTTTPSTTTTTTEPTTTTTTEPTTTTTAEPTTTTTAPPEAGEIVVQKLVQSEDDPQTFAFTFNTVGFELADNTLAHGESSSSGNLEAGNYSVSEQPVTGWTQVSATCDGGNTPESIDLAAGETVTCTFVNTIETEVEASIVVTVDGTCEVDGDEGEGVIDVEISVDGGADVVISDSDGDVIETLSSSGTVTVPEGATYSWEATPNEGFEFPSGSETSGSITIETCSDDPETLPFTGLDTGMMSLFASALLGGGLLLVTAMRRQEEA